MATRAGIPPLAAARLRGDLRDALQAVGGAVELACSADEDGLTVVISSPGGNLERIRAALDGHAATDGDSDGAVVVRVRRTPLRSV